MPTLHNLLLLNPGKRPDECRVAEIAREVAKSVVTAPSYEIVRHYGIVPPPRPRVEVKRDRSYTLSSATPVKLEDLLTQILHVLEDMGVKVIQHPAEHERLELVAPKKKSP